ncbi:MAG: protein-disulfide reductase DsbD family protein [Bacteroidales bacterium]
MSRITLLFGLALLFNVLNVQIYNPVKWDFSYEKKNNNRYEIIITATIEKDSYIYSMDIPANGPVPTTIQFDTSSLYILEDKPYATTISEEKFDEAFGFKIKTFSGKAEFRQKIMSDLTYFTVSGVINFMSCTKNICLPPKDVEFTVRIGEASDKEQISPSVNRYYDGKGMLKFFIGSFLLGLIGLFTPCVYPMIPMTIAFFTRVKEKRSVTIINALVFGMSIVLIYALPGIIISLTGTGAGFANALSTHWILNTIFFLLFIIFAVSFFGAFEIMLPNRWVSSTDSKVEKGGIMASFFLALTTVIVSFSCTGPIVGSLLVEALSGNLLRPAIGMFAFGLAFAVPFTLFALFPAALTRLPKSGGWLNSVKIVLAFLMLAFSLKFLTTIDSVYGLNLISRELFLTIWIVIFSLMGFYLMGKIRFPHDSLIQHIGILRLILIIIVFSFVIYMIPGLFGAELRGMAFILPAKRTAEYFQPGSLPLKTSSAISSSAVAEHLPANCSQPRYADKFQLPYGLSGYFDFNQGLTCARELGKPVLIDFKGHACANCKLMEARVWSEPQVLERLQKFVIISLYTDDRTQLPENEWIISINDGRVKKTIGKINEDLEITRFKTNAIPLYVITDHEGNPLNKPMSTNMKTVEYIKWLDEGLMLFAAKQ